MLLSPITVHAEEQGLHRVPKTASSQVLVDDGSLGAKASRGLLCR
jgi:hypothetical protein